MRVKVPRMGDSEEPRIIVLSGEYDIYTREVFAALINPAIDWPHVVLDFKDVSYMDSTCIGEMIQLRKRRARKGFPPKHLAGMNRLLRRVFEITSLDQIWPMFATTQEAYAAFKS